MKKLVLLVVLGMISISSYGQYNSGRYRIDKFYDNVVPNDSNHIDVNLYVTITKQWISIKRLRNDQEVFFTPNKTIPVTFEYRVDGQVKEYYKWLIDGGFIIFYEKDSIKYLAKYKQNVFRLPEEYVTYRITGDLEEYLKGDF